MIGVGFKVNTGKTIIMGTGRKIQENVTQVECVDAVWEQILSCAWNVGSGVTRGVLACKG
jgi:hypothetical protein